MLICIAVEDTSVLGVLSSSIHVTWAVAAGGRLGVGNDPRYNKGLCFDAFPFPDAQVAIRAEISALASSLDEHRKAALTRDERVTMTGMYNVVEKLRSGIALTPKERTIHEIAACGILRDLHDELDRLVAPAYGWPWPLEREEILERLVALHDERVEEEKAGKIRWLQPEYQIPRFAPEQAATLALDDARDTTPARKRKSPQPSKSDVEPTRRPSWPEKAFEQLAAIGALLAQRSLTAAEVTEAFDGAKKDIVARHLETLELMGEVVVDHHGRYRGAKYAA